MREQTALRRVLETAALLNSSDAEILRVIAWERLSHTEVAAVLGLSPNAVH